MSLRPNHAAPLANVIREGTAVEQYVSTHKFSAAQDTRLWTAGMKFAEAAGIPYSTSKGGIHGSVQDAVEALVERDQLAVAGNKPNAQQMVETDTALLHVLASAAKRIEQFTR